MANIAIHPLAEMIPPMGDAEYAELRNDIKTHGMRAPIVLYEHQVLDGRHRLRACQELGITPQFTEYDGDEPVGFVVSMNIHRRQLSVSQRAMVLVRYMEPLTREAKERKLANLKRGATTPTRSGDRDGKTWEDDDPSHNGVAGIVAEIGGISAVTVRRAKRAVEIDPKLEAPLLSGAITANEAYQQVRYDKRPDKGRYSPRTVERVAEQAQALAVAVQATNLRSSVASLDSERRVRALMATRTGQRALNALARELRR